MICRGSLRQTLAAMKTAFASLNYPMLSIIHNDRSSYYTLITEAELVDLGDKSTLSTHRLVLRCTRGELDSILKSDQLNLKLGG